MLVPLDFSVYRDWPVSATPLPSMSLAGNTRSVVAAPTVVTHGAALDTEDASGPSLPPATTTNTPLRSAPKVATAMGSS
jgi:hypothetical protein